MFYNDFLNVRLSMAEHAIKASKKASGIMSALALKFHFVRKSFVNVRKIFREHAKGEWVSAVPFVRFTFLSCSCFARR